MSIMTVTTRITRQYLERKTKAELAQWYMDLLDQTEKREKELETALKPFAEFYLAFQRKPITHLDPETIYAIHGGDGFPLGASLKWPDVRRAAEVLSSLDRPPEKQD
jgi:hypothetical protein